MNLKVKITKKETEGLTDQEKKRYSESIKTLENYNVKSDDVYGSHDLLGLLGKDLSSKLILKSLSKEIRGAKIGMISSSLIILGGAYSIKTDHEILGTIVSIWGTSELVYSSLHYAYSLIKRNHLKRYLEDMF